jgi:glucosamine 6-phosphate synthetase-like amidotransferase/phosphosugar isomerase protein
MEALMAEIQRRGAHAAGAASVGVERTIWGKAPVPAKRFIRGAWWAKMMKADPRLLIGHARFATHGDPKDNANNHPFVSDDHRWFVVHNGVLGDDVSVRSPTMGECDSELILRMIETYGFKKTVELMGGFERSSFACLALDAKERRMYAWRNSGNPLVVADLTDSIGAVLLASTEDILRAALVRAGLGFVELTDENLRSLKPGYWYTFPFGCAGGRMADLPTDRAERASPFQRYVTTGRWPEIEDGLIAVEGGGEDV